MSLPTKLVLVVRSDLAMSEAANAAMVVGLSVGGRLPHLLGDDGKDASGGVHAGLNTNPVPVLTASPAELGDLYDRAQQRDELLVVGFNDIARRARDYGDYLQALSETPRDDVAQAAAAIFGPRNRVTGLTKRFPLLGADA